MELSSALHESYRQFRKLHCSYNSFSIIVYNRGRFKRRKGRAYEKVEKIKNKKRNMMRHGMIFLGVRWKNVNKKINLMFIYGYFWKFNGTSFPTHSDPLHMPWSPFTCHCLVIIKTRLPFDKLIRKMINKVSKIHVF